MSEQYRDPWRMTLPKGQFFENLHGDDALSQTKQTVSAVPVESEAIGDAPVVEVVVPVDESSSAPAIEESSSTAPIESEAIVENPVDAPAAPEVVPPAEVPAVS